MINWMYFPKSDPPHPLCGKIVSAFQKHEKDIASDKHTLDSNEVLRKVASDLTALGFLVESGKKRHEKVLVPVLFGINGKIDKSFEVDAWHKQVGFVVEVEAGRATINHQFLKDLFEACMMQGEELSSASRDPLRLRIAVNQP